MQWLTADREGLVSVRMGHASLFMPIISVSLSVDKIGTQTAGLRSFSSFLAAFIGPNWLLIEENTNWLGCVRFPCNPMHVSVQVLVGSVWKKTTNSTLGACGPQFSEYRRPHLTALVSRVYNEKDNRSLSLLV